VLGAAAARFPRSCWHSASVRYEAGINRSYMSKLEKGASYPGLEIIAKLATVLEVEPANCC
jgi:Helix-turn-helix